MRIWRYQARGRCRLCGMEIHTDGSNPSRSATNLVSETTKELDPDEFGRILDLRWSLARDQCASQPICALRVGPNRGKTPKSCPFKNEGFLRAPAAFLDRRLNRMRPSPSGWEIEVGKLSFRIAG